MTNLRNLFYAFSFAALTVPVLVSAQLNVKVQDTGLPEGGISAGIETFMKWILGIVAFGAIISFAIAGILYFTAAGDEDRVGNAKNALMYSIIGVVVALIGLIILQAVDAWLSGDSVEF